MRAQLSTHDYEQLSAYLDGQLAPGERTKLEAHLKTRPELLTALEDLRQTRTLLRMAPRKRAPRNFTLTPAMVGDMPPARKASRGWGGFNLFPVLSFASAVTVLLLVAVLLFDLGSSRTAMQAAPSVAALPQGRSANTQAATEAQAPAAPMLAGTPSAATSDAQAGAGQTGPGSTSNTAPSAAAAKAADNSGIPGGPMNWYGATGMGGGGSGGMGYGVDPYSQVQKQYGVGGSADGSLSVPPQALQSLPAPEAQSAVQAAQPDPQISGTGPILGVPAADQAGKIIESQGLMGHPDQVTPLPTSPAAAQPTPAQPTPSLSDQPYPAAAHAQEPVEPWYTRTVAGLPALRLVEGSLLAAALATGIAAFYLWRRRL